jgi:hypothetical protein
MLNIFTDGERSGAVMNGSSNRASHNGYGTEYIFLDCNAGIYSATIQNQEGHRTKKDI